MVKRNSGTSKEDICQNQFTAYVVLAVKRKRQAYIKKKIRDKENQAKREEEQSNFGAEENTVWDRLEVQNEELVAAVQQLKPKARFIVTGYVLKGKTFKELAQETKLTERAAASTYYSGERKMTFIELLLASKGGSKSAFEELFGRYKNLLRKYSVINGIFDDDLYQEQCMVFVHCIEIFEVK